MHRVQAEVVIARRHSDANAERHQKAVQDLASRADELKQAQTSYNKSVRFDHLLHSLKLGQPYMQNT